MKANYGELIATMNLSALQD